MGIDTGLGNNRFTIRRGSTAPNNNNLLEYELGYAAQDKNLYLGLGEDTAPVLLGREVRAGLTNPAASDFDFNEEANVKKVYLWTGHVPETQPLASNKNLLQNWDFRHDVSNSIRKLGTYTNAGKCIDRWRLYTGTVAIEDDGLRISVPSSAENNGWFGQYLEQSTSEGARKILPSATFSAVITEVTGEASLLFQFTDESTDYMKLSDGSVKITAPGFYTFTTRATGKTINRPIICVYPGSEVKVACVKLEMGEMSTLMYDPPADYWEELMKCTAYGIAHPGEV